MITMARYRRTMALRPINRIKHVVEFQGAVAGGTVQIIPLASAVDTPTLADVDGVETGSKVNGIYIRMEVGINEAHVAGAIPNIYMFVAKNPGGNLAFPSPNAVGGDDNKRFVIHQEMSMIENTGKGGNPRTLFNGVIVIPKGYRRNGPNDILFISFLCPALDCVVCVQAHYKEFR